MLPRNSLKIIVLATSWGLDVSADEFCAMAGKEGYEGIETWWPTEESERAKLFEALEKHGLQVGFLCAGHAADFETHHSQFRDMITRATESPVRPLYINCHSGKDYFTTEQNQQLIDLTLGLSQSSGLLICHETHRSRMLYSAPVARKFIEANPAMKVTLDASHWCNVHESYLEDQEETMALLLARTEHIHARIGHPEGPQVNDPRAPEWKYAVNRHFAWWDKVVERKKNEGGILTFLAEFGPPDYMPTLPHSRKPVSDQWAINVHMMNLIKNRYC